MAKTSSRVKALLERTHQLQSTGDAATPAPIQPPSPPPHQDILPPPVSSAPPAPPIDLPSLSFLVKSVSPERGLDLSLDSRSASFSTLKPRKHKITNFDGLLNSYLKARKSAEKELKSLSIASDRLITYLETNLQPQFQAESSFRQRSEE